MKVIWLVLLVILGWAATAHAQSSPQRADVDINDMPDTAILRKFRPPLVDWQRFEPLPPEQRMLMEPKVRLLARRDGYDFCARITGIPVGSNARPMACAYWNVKRSECTVITPEVTGYNYVGHELRHCFEGAFHE